MVTRGGADPGTRYVHVDHLGSVHVPQPVTTAPGDWVQNPYVQIEGGFLGGLVLGAAPFAAVGQELLDAAKVLPHGTPEARRGLAVGQIVGGIVGVVGGFTGEVVGGLASVTGIGAALGMPAIVVSSGLVIGGAANIEVGIRGLMTTGSGSRGAGDKMSTLAAKEESRGKRIWTQTGRIKAEQLSREGRIRFVPPENWNPANPARGPQKGFIDRFGNEWVSGPSRTPGEPFEWDVQLSSTGRAQLGWASPDRMHLNVSLNGEITH